MSLITRNEKAKYYAGRQHRPQSKVLRWNILHELCLVDFSNTTEVTPLVYTVHGQGWKSEKRSSQQTVAKETTK